MSSKRFPPKDADFNTYIDRVVPYLVANATRLGVSSGNITDLQAEQLVWADRFSKANNPNTDTKTIRDEKNASRRALEDMLRDIYGDIPQSALTPADRDTMNLPEREAGKPRPAITERPNVLIQALPAALVEVECRVTADSSRPSRHPDSDAVEYSHMLEAYRPSGAEPLPATDWETRTTGKAKFTIALAEADAGRMVVVKARWKNATDDSKSGPWSLPMKIMVGM